MLAWAKNGLLLGVAVLAARAADARNDARWISDPAAPAADAARAPIALQFRRTMRLSARPSAFRVRVSADNRLRLFVNGQSVLEGPARGDLAHWRYEEIDLAPYLHAGRNLVAAEVWNDGQAAPLAQISSGRTGFTIAAHDTSRAGLIDSGPAWEVRVDTSRSVTPGMPQVIRDVGEGYYAAGGPETITGKEQLDDWLASSAPGDGWHPAVPVVQSALSDLTLVKDDLPPMANRTVPSGRVVRTSGIHAGAFPRGAVTIPANSEATILVDAGRVLSAYPALEVSGGAGARVTLDYAEALYEPVPQPGQRGPRFVRMADRAAVGNGVVRGLSDTFLPDGRSHRILRPFWWRAWRFVEVRVRTGAAPLTIERLDTRETGYPFVAKGRFVSSDPELNDIWRIGWNTALFDAHETYMDTAYWEQLQYIGDTRIQMLISYDVSGDARLARQALAAFDHSRVVEGLPQSAWPETSKNVIPPFALLWIGALHDYWMRQPDTGPLRNALSGMRSVLDWYSHNLAASGIVQEKSGWPFVDWSGALDGWTMRGGKGPENCVISMMYFGALRQAADLENAVGDASLGAADLAQSDRVRSSLDTHCWDAARGLYADTPAKTQFSQHAAILSVLYDLVPKDQQQAMLGRATLPEGGISAPGGLLGSTYYFSFYLAQALDHAGLTDKYIGMLTPWRRMLRQHFTTFPETPDPSRSDSHAWSAHPTSGLLTYVAGIQPASPGFASVRIAPHLGQLTKLDAAMAHPAGLIETRYAVSSAHLTATIMLPHALNGTFEWRGRTVPLHEGRNAITLDAAGS